MYATLANLIQATPASQFVGSTEPAVETMTPLSLSMPVVPSVPQEEYDLKLAEIITLQQRLADKQQQVDDLEAAVMVAQAQAQATLIVTNAEVASSAIQIDVSADHSTHTTAPNVNKIGSAIPAEQEAGDTTNSAPSVSAEEVARLLAEKDAETKKERIRAKRAEKANRETEQTLQFIRERYDEASSSAVREVNKAKELEEKVERLQGQLRFGLKQRDAHLTSVVAQYKTEVEKCRGQVKMLLDQNRLTDDNVRMRAAAYRGLKTDNTRLEVELRSAKAKNKFLSDRNDDLVGQVELFRARQMGVLAVVDDSDDEDYSYQSDSSTTSELSNESSSNSGPGTTGSTSAPVPVSVPIPLTASQLMPDTQDLAPIAQSTSRADRGDSMVNIEAYKSPWTKGTYYEDEAVSRP